MTLSFTQKINGKPTYFTEKIWTALIHLNDELKDGLKKYEEYRQQHVDKFGKDFGYNWLEIFPKIHTIRRDEPDRWKKGSIIHFVINNRSPERFQFAPEITCISTQTIEIKHPEIDFPGLKGFQVIVDGKNLSREEIEKIAVNDGFDEVVDFVNYFKEDFTGKLIHWTNHQY